MSKQLVVFVAIGLFLLIIGAGYYFFASTGKPKIDIGKFTGEVVSIEGDAITLRGIFSGPAGTITEDLLSTRIFKFRVDGSTGFKKIETQLPSWEELTAGGATSGSYNLEDLPRIKGPSSLDELKAAILKGATSVEAGFPYSIYNSKDPVADSVFFHTIIAPPLPLLLQTP